MSALPDRHPCFPSEPFCDEDTDDALRGAVDELVMKRSPAHRGDARAALHALASLSAEIVLALADAVADARDQDYSWGEIGGLLGRRKRSVKRGYAAYAKRRRAPFELD